jgi:two-component system, NarL family, invasion response regulator UvrY
MTTHHEKIRIIIADDHAIVREGLAQIISTALDMTVVDQADNGRELLDKIRTLELDMVLLDLDMPEKNGWDVMRQLKVEKPNLPIIILSVNPEEEYAEACFRDGASGYLNKLAPLELVLKAIRQVAQGKKFISLKLAEKIASRLGGDTETPPHKTLSSRELEVFRLIASGKSVHNIAGELALSPATISTYRARILEKLNLSSNAELTRYAFQLGILK